MISNRDDIKLYVTRRIASMILLFTFIAFPLAAQTDPPAKPPASQETPAKQKQQMPAPQNQEIPAVQRQEPLQEDPAVSSGEDFTFSTGENGGDSVRFSRRDSERSSRRDSTQRINVDTLEHSPRKAMIYSLILPGLGQAYNNKYFKIPFVYAALGGVSYWIYYNTQGYRTASDRYAEDQSSINERFLRAWRRNLELSYITLTAAYALQVLDAYVDAHLFYWDVSPELTLRVAPDIRSHFTATGMPVNNYGLKCSLTF